MPESNYPITRLYILLYQEGSSRLLLLVNFRKDKFEITKASEISSRHIRKIHNVVVKCSEMDSNSFTWNNYAVYRFGGLLFIGEIKKKDFLPNAVGFLRRISRHVYRAIMESGNLIEAIN